MMKSHGIVSNLCKLLTVKNYPPVQFTFTSRLNVILSRQEDYDPKLEIGPDGNPDDVILCKSIEVIVLFVFKLGLIDRLHRGLTNFFPNFLSFFFQNTQRLF